MAIALIHGPSGSGKTDRLVRTYMLAKRYNLDVIVIKPHIPGYESRLPEGLKEDVYTLGVDIIPQNKRYGFILVEDVQFFSIPEIHTLLDTYVALTNNLVFYGVQHTYAGLPFESVDYLLNHKNELLDITEELRVRCAQCNQEIAVKTQRLINGFPATHTPVVFIKPFVKHIPVCNKCYVSPEEIIGLKKEP